jgi:hypothetical protein
MPKIHIRPLPEHKDVSYDPDFLWVKSDRNNLWLDDEHYLGALDRTVEEDKFYLKRGGEMPFFQVIEITDERRDMEVPEYAEGITDPLKKVIVDVVYEAGNDDPVPEDPKRIEVVKFALEAEPEPPESPPVGAVPPMTEFPAIPFNKIDQ